MPNIDGIELSDSEIMLAEDMGIDEYIDYEDEKACIKCGDPISGKGNVCYSCAMLEKEDQE